MAQNYFLFALVYKYQNLSLEYSNIKAMNRFTTYHKVTKPSDLVWSGTFFFPNAFSIDLKSSKPILPGRRFLGVSFPIDDNTFRFEGVRTTNFLEGKIITFGVLGCEFIIMIKITADDFNCTNTYITAKIRSNWNKHRISMAKVIKYTYQLLRTSKIKLPTIWKCQFQFHINNQTSSTLS